MAFIGDMNGSSAQRIAPKITLTPHGGSVQDVDGVIVDGSTATATAEATLAAALQSGRTLALVNPTMQQLASVRAITGCGPSAPAPLVAFTQSKDGGPSRCLTVPRGTITSKAFSEVGVGPVRSSVSPVDLGANIIRAVQAAALGGVGAGSNQLIPPMAAIYGTSQLIVPISWQVQGPFLNNAAGVSEADDEYAWGYWQHPEGNVTVNFYVYYVNGVYGKPSYYAVIVEQIASFNSGTEYLSPPEGDAIMVSYCDNSRGYCQSRIMCGPTQVTAPQATGLYSCTCAPSSLFSAPNNPLVLPMWLKSDQTAGYGPGLFSATVYDSNNFTAGDWTVQNMQASSAPAWDYHLTSPWNPVTYPEVNMPYWWQMMYNPTTGAVLQFPQISIAGNNVNFVNYSAWQFDASLISPPNTVESRVMDVTFSGSFQHFVCLFHNWNGCVGVQGKHHDLFISDYSFPWQQSLNLDKIAAPTGPIPPC